LILSNKLLAFPKTFLTLTQPLPNCRRYWWKIFSYWKFFNSIGVEILTHQIPIRGRIWEGIWLIYPVYILIF